MDKKTLNALKGSIKKWYSIAYLGKRSEGTKDCPLCSAFWGDLASTLNRCDGCPVKEHSGSKYCMATPVEEYEHLDDEDAKRVGAAKKELDFLISLLPEGETAIVDGWEYGWRWA